MCQDLDAAPPMWECARDWCRSSKKSFNLGLNKKDLINILLINVKEKTIVFIRNQMIVTKIEHNMD